MILVALTVSILLSTDAAADKLQQARVHFEAAERLFAAGRYAEAAAGFERAYEVSPHPALFFNMGQCYERAGDPARAAARYRTYLQQTPGADDEAVVRAAVSRLEVDAAQAGASEQARPTSALADNRQLSEKLRPTQPSLRTGTYLAAGTSVVGLGAGIGLGLGALNAQTRLRGDIHSRETAQQLFDTAAQRSTGANISYAIAASAAATAIILYLLSPDDSTPFAVAR